MLKRATIFFAVLCAGGIAAGQAPSFPTDLKQSLDLSDSQISRILSLNRDYTELASNKSQRTYELYREIFEESARNPVDPLELGKRYAEQEAIRRELKTALTQVRAKDREVLNAAQLMKLKTLEDLFNVQLLASEAVCENILVAPVRSSSASFSFTSGTVIRDPLNVLSLASPMLFTPYPPTCEYVYGPSFYQAQSSFPIALRQYLDLSDAQINGIVNLNLAYSDLSYRKGVRAEQIRLEIRDETAKDPPDPMELGIRYAELEAIQRELNDERAKIPETATALLNASQKAKVKMLQDAVNSQPLIAEAFCEYLMDPFRSSADDRGYYPYRFPSCEYR